MKHSFINKIMITKVFVLIGLCSLPQSLTQNRFMPNLPLGEYRVQLDKVYSCESTKNHPIVLNLHLSKKTLSITEVKGNITNSIPFDDTLSFDMNFSIWGSTGGWIPNSYILIKKKACSYMKNLYGNAWLTFMKGFNMTNYSCPIPVGTYHSSGVDLMSLKDHSWPKVYFYGKYKTVLHLKNVENKVVCCEVMEFTLLRPWEKQI